MFGQVAGVDRDEGVNAINYYHIIGDSESITKELSMGKIYSCSWHDNVLPEKFDELCGKFGSILTVLM